MRSTPTPEGAVSVRRHQKPAFTLQLMLPRSCALNPRIKTAGPQPEVERKANKHALTGWGLSGATPRCTRPKPRAVAPALPALFWCSRATFPGG
jgi:hypothetical protein